MYIYEQSLGFTNIIKHIYGDYLHSKRVTLCMHTFNAMYRDVRYSLLAFIIIILAHSLNDSPRYIVHLAGDSAADYSIENKDMVLIWAFGQVSPEYSHWSLSDAEFNLTQNQHFFPIDQLKYHGNKNRGATTINFFEVDSGKLKLSSALFRRPKANIYRFV